MTRIKTLLTLVLLSSLATPKAHADQVVFTKFVVNSCKELGECNWIVQFQFGYGDNWTNICPDPTNGICSYGWPKFEVDSGETAYFKGKHQFPFENYPLRLTFLVEEFDGAFDGGLDYVGSDTVMIHGQGSYWVFFENDEGHVEIHFEVLPETATSQAPLEAVPLPRTYMGILEGGTDEHSFSAALDGGGLSYESFGDSFDNYVDSGKRLMDVETFVTDEGRRYIGAYREGDGPYVWGPGHVWENFVQSWEVFTEGGLRLVDFDTHMEGDLRMYSGSFVEDSGNHAFVVSDWDGLVQAWEEKSALGLRLHDVETYMVDNERKFAGVFREGNGGHALWISSWGPFVETWEQLTEDGLALIDVETYLDAGTRIYIGVYGVASQGHVLLAGHDWENFLGEYQSYLSSGYRLTDIEVYEGAVAGPFSEEKPANRLTEIPQRIVKLPLDWAALRDARRSDLPTLVFRRGDTNADATVDISDALKLFGFLFGGQEEPGCMDAADGNGDAAVDISDGLAILQFLFAPATSLPEPGAHSCGVPAARPLGCETYEVCDGEGGGGPTRTPADSNDELREAFPPRGILPPTLQLPPSLLPPIAPVLIPPPTNEGPRNPPPPRNPRDGRAP